MTAALWTPIASMVGVLVGGGLTFLTQRTTQRATERAEERKRQADLAEARRTEQIQALTDFIRFAYQAEGVAHSRPENWGVDDDWLRAARPAMDGLRVAETSVGLLCHPSLKEPTTAYARALNQAVWRDRDELPLAERLEPFKSVFLATARRSLASSVPAAKADSTALTEQQN